MIDVNIPGFGHRSLRHLVLDYNGTLALDGQILPGIFPRLEQLATRLHIHILTADTHGTVRAAFAQTAYTVHVLEPGNERASKAAYIATLGKEHCACFGNGANDALMLSHAGLSVAVLQQEGLALPALLNAHILIRDINDGLDLLLHPNRLLATLRQ